MASKRLLLLGIRVRKHSLVNVAERSFIAFSISFPLISASTDVTYCELSTNFPDLYALATQFVCWILVSGCACFASWWRRQGEIYFKQTNLKQLFACWVRSHLLYVKSVLTTKGLDIGINCTTVFPLT